jgi:hypothetical protein
MRGELIWPDEEVGVRNRCRPCRRNRGSDVLPGWMVANGVSVRVGRFRSFSGGCFVLLVIARWLYVHLRRRKHPKATLVLGRATLTRPYFKCTSAVPAPNSPGEMSTSSRATAQTSSENSGSGPSEPGVLVAQRKRFMSAATNISVGSELPTVTNTSEPESHARTTSVVTDGTFDNSVATRRAACRSSSAHWLADDRC